MVKVIIMSGFGINCESESAQAFKLAGAEPEVVHINDLISGKKKMQDYQIMMFPGGFSYGDDTGSGNAYANKIKNNLWSDLLAFIDAGKLIQKLNQQSTHAFSKSTTDMFGTPEVTTTDITANAQINQHAIILNNFVRAILFG